MALRYWAMIVGLGLIWGTSFAANAVLLREIGPLTVSFARIGFGAAFVLVFMAATRHSMRVTRKQAFQLFLLGAANFAIPFAVYPIAQGELASGIAGIMNGLTPVAVVLISHMWPGGDKATPSNMLGVGFGFLGIYLISKPSMSVGETSELWAMVVILLAPISYGVSLNIMRMIHGVDPFVKVAYSLSFATVMLIPFAIGFEGIPHMVRIESWLWLVWVGFIGTGFSFIVLYWLVPRVGGTNMSTATFVAPVTAILLGVLFLNERLETAHIPGIFAIFVGMVVIDGRVLAYLGRKDEG